LFYSLWTGADAYATAWYMSWGVLAAGILQLLVVYVGVLHAGINIGIRMPRFTPNVKRLLILAVPAAVTGGITQINQMIGQAIASSKEGAIAALQYADRIYQLPLGVVGIAVGVVLLPELARALKSGHLKEAGNLQNRSIEFVLFLTLPAAVALWILCDEIIRVLYERGAFHQENTALVGSILAIYGLGLPAFVLIKALQPGFYAREDTRTPMRFSAVAVAVNCAIALSLFPYFGARGIATAETCAGWLSTVLLFTTLLRRGHLTWEWALARRAVLLVVASAIMGAAILYLAHRWEPWLASGVSLLTKVSTLGLLILISMAVYFTAAFVIGGADFGMIRRNLNRKPPASAPPSASAEAINGEG
jgi:putative peptidoglycan lipid II flippase